MKIEMRALDKVRPYEKNPRHNEAAVEKVAKSIREFGWRQPIVVDEDGVIIAGHTRWRAARELGLDKVPVHVATGLTPAQVKGYRLADNRVGEEATWNEGLLGIELGELREMGLSLDLTGFDDDELQKLLGDELTIVERVSVQPPPTMAWVLVGIPTVRYGEIAELIERIAANPDTLVETVLNDNDQNR